MKKILFLFCLLKTVFLAAQSDSTRLIYVNGKCLNDNNMSYVQGQMTVFGEVIASAETYWSVSWTGHDGSEMLKTNYGLNTSRLKEDMKKSLAAYNLRDYKGQPLKISYETDFFNYMAMAGFRFVKKEQLPFALGMLIVTYSFERK